MRKFCKVISVILTVLFVIMIPVNVVVRMFDNTISLLIAGNSFWTLENKDENAIYFEGEYASQDKRLEAGLKLCYQVEAEGATLLLNNGVLPLKSGASVSTLSVNSVDLTYGGTGSGNVDASKADNLKAALEKSGFTVNPTLWDWYTSPEAEELKAANSEGGGKGENDLLGGQAPIVEIDPKNYPANVKDSIATYGDAVIITFSRVGGEGYDCSFPGYEGVADAPNYLALNDNERALMAYAKQLKDEGKIKSIVVLINTSNALQVDFLKNNEYGVDACLWVGGLGIAGTNAVTDILAGTVNPSGSLVDTYCYDNLSSPAMHNYIALEYSNFNGQVPDQASTYMVYQEGIYVGYKYYETRYFDAVMNQGNAGNYASKYFDEVAFTFGHGLSYTTFTYSDMKVEKGTNEYGENCYNVSVTVHNDGAVDGKEVVQIYLSSPYTEYDKDKEIEKAAVQLIGFGKTDVIKAGESETITIQVDERDMAAYDAKGAGTYILDAGTYYLTAATDAHNAANNILAAHGKTTADGMDEDGNTDLVHSWDMEFDKVTYSKSLNGTEIKNQLQHADPNEYYGKDVVTFLSRSDWEGTWRSNIELEIIESMVDELALERWATLGENFYEVPEEWHNMPVLDAKNGLTLYDMFNEDRDNDGIKANKDYDDPAWDKLLENLTLDELLSVGDCFHWRHPVPSVNAPGSRDENGPQGLTVSLFGGGLVTIDGKSAEATAFTSEDVMAATFNTELIYEVGTMIANDCLDASVSCLYGPGANTHRTPYGGRNFEYYSEDGFLAGEMAGAEVGALLDHGVDVVLKHFALNDTEQDRLGQAAWLTEQAAREIYLKAFQKALEENDGRGGIMTSYTRWGTTWNGFNQNLMTGILRGEWGNHSMHITDNIITDYCDASAAIVAGGVTCFDAMMPMASDDLKATAGKGDVVVINALVEAMHHNLYTIINSAAMNGVGPNTVVKAITPNIVNLVLYITIALGVIGIGGCIIFRKRH
ncbi:MAG: glycoside hydrolase family 3 C-terminal domain-containing protein [Clostridia bacterium]|nr:glycoside hydrolase family 3 C-terminal domain-containing protein [Clostridia bacterium]